MTSRTIVEWHCNRCGTEESIEAHKNHAWSKMYRRDIASTSEAGRVVGGDLCPDCDRSLVAWWHAPKQPARVKEPLP